MSTLKVLVLWSACFLIGYGFGTLLVLLISR